jgi:elongation factor P
MQVKANDIRKGMIITMDGVNFRVLEATHHTPGNLRAMVQTKLRNMSNNSLIEKRLRSVDQVEVPFVETREFDYLYSQGDEHVFMDIESYDQLSFDTEIIGESMHYLLPNSRVLVQYVADKAVSIELPASVDLVVADTLPEYRDDRASGDYKDAKMETGLNVKVPLFIVIGEKIKIDTRTGEYISRVK